MIKDSQDVLKWLARINEYEDIHDKSEIKLTQSEILSKIQNEIIRLRDSVNDTTYTPFEKKMMFIKRCVLRQFLDDLLEVPDDIRPWHANEKKWIQEMETREQSGR